MMESPYKHLPAFGLGIAGIGLLCLAAALIGCVRFFTRPDMVPLFGAGNIDAWKFGDAFSSKDIELSGFCSVTCGATVRRSDYERARAIVISTALKDHIHVWVGGPTPGDPGIEIHAHPPLLRKTPKT